MRTWLLAFMLPLAFLPAGCTSTPAADRTPASAPAEERATEPTPSGTPTLEALDLDALGRTHPPRAAYVHDRVLQRRDGSRLRLHLGLRGRWGVTSLVPVGDGYLVTDDRWFEGSVGMHRVDARGTAVETWTSTGPALAGPRGGAAWVSVVPPESGQSVPTELHAGPRTLRIDPLVWPVLSSFDGRTATFTALQRVGRTYERRGFETDLVDPPRRAPMPSTRAYSPDRRHWWELRRWRLVIGGPDGEVVLRSRPFVQAFARPTWEDDTHLLVTITQRRRQAIGRIDLDGGVTLASGWRPFAIAGFTFVPHH